jgi:hypothetical protein
MKARGAYNPVTQSAEGSYEVDRTDYRETRTNWLLILGAIIAVVLVAYFLMKDALTALLNPVTNLPGNVANAIVSPFKQTSQDSIDTVVRAAGKQPGDANTQAYWDAVNRYTGESVVANGAVSAGNVVLSTPIINNLGQPLLAQAVIAGEGFHQELDSYGDTARLDADPLKTVIVSGEAISKTFTGFDPYAAGKATSQWFASLSAPKW